MAKAEDAPPPPVQQLLAHSTRPPEQEEMKRRILSVPNKLRTALMPFQKIGVEACLNLQGRALLGDEPGLGKTIQALALACAYRDCWPLLIVVPSSMRWPWVDEWEKWVVAGGVCRSSALNVVRDGNNDAIVDPQKLVTIVTYSLLCSDNIATQVQARGFQCIIADESHSIKNDRAMRTKALLPVLERAKRVLLLSGTPALNRPAELWCQLHALMPGAFGRTIHTWFAKHFCNGKKQQWGWDISGGSNLDQLNDILRRSFLVRRLKENVLDQLPPKTRQRVGVDAPPNMAGASETSEVAVQNLCSKCMRNPSNGEARKELLTALREAYMSGGSAKVSATAALVGDLLEGGTSKLLVFAHHRAVMDNLEGAFRAMRIVTGFIRIDGTTPSLERFERCKRFQTDAACRVALLSVTAAGQGLTLTAAHDVIFAELHWVPAVLMQAEDRVHRIGQKASGVTIRYVCLKDSLDNFMWRTLSRKLQTIGLCVDGAAASLKAADVAAPDDAGGVVLDIDGDGDGGGLVSQFLRWHRKAYGECSRDSGADHLATKRNRGSGGGGVSLRVHYDNEDIRSFFTRRDAKAKGSATARNDGGACGGTLPSSSQAAGDGSHHADEQNNQEVVVIDGDGDDGDDDVIVIGDDDERCVKVNDPATTMDAASVDGARTYAFDVSMHTGRCFVASIDTNAAASAIGTRDALWKDATVLGSFTIEDAPAWRLSAMATASAADDETDIPPPELRDLRDAAACKRFARKWLSHRPQVRAAVAASGVLVGMNTNLSSCAASASTPHRAAVGAVEAAGGGGSTVRVGKMDAFVSRSLGANVSASAAAAPSSTTTAVATCAQCATCGAAMSTMPRNGKPFCSEQCYKMARLLTDAGEARKQLFAVEKGVCQSCGLDCHKLHGDVQALGSVHARERLLRSSGFPSASASSIARSAEIHEGMLWQADHIIPVAEGGGECTLENLRTLCTPCHASATRDLHARLTKRRRLGVEKRTTPETLGSYFA